MKEIFDNDKLAAMFFASVICVVAMYTIGTEAKDILLPVLTGMFGIVTGASIK